MQSPGVVYWFDDESRERVVSGISDTSKTASRMQRPAVHCDESVTKCYFASSRTAAANVRTLAPSDALAASRSRSVASVFNVL